MPVRLTLVTRRDKARALDTRKNFVSLAVSTASLLGPLMGGCSNQKTSFSQLKGHYEDMTSEEVSQIIKRRPTTIPEYSFSDKVIIGSPLVSDIGLQNTAIPKAVLEAGADILIVGSQMARDGLDSYQFTKFSEIMAPYKSRIQVLASDMLMSPSMWARDWAPIVAVAGDRTRVLLDFNYYNERPVDDFAPSLIARETENSVRLSVPLYLEGGNLLTTESGTCLTTERTLEANRISPKSYIVDNQGIVIGEEGSAPVLEGQKIMGGTQYFDRDGTPRIRVDDVNLSRNDIEKILKESVGCARVVIFPRLPHESTGHLDMWAKALTDDLMLVSVIDPEAIQASRDDELRSVATDVADFLNQRATDLTNLGFKVVRIPMPLPHVKNGPLAPPKDREYGFRSFTNSLLLATKKGRFSLVPHYEEGYVTGVRGSTIKNFPYPDHVRLEEIEVEVQAIYKRYGFEVIPIPADELVAYGGAVHCATMQIPATL